MFRPILQWNHYKSEILIFIILQPLTLEESSMLPNYDYDILFHEISKTSKHNIFAVRKQIKHIYFTLPSNSSHLYSISSTLLPHLNLPIHLTLPLPSEKVSNIIHFIFVFSHLNTLVILNKLQILACICASGTTTSCPTAILLGFADYRTKWAKNLSLLQNELKLLLLKPIFRSISGEMFTKLWEIIPIIEMKNRKHWVSNQPNFGPEDTVWYTDGYETDVVGAPKLKPAW